MLIPEGRWVTVQPDRGEKNNIVFSNEVYHYASADSVKKELTQMHSFLSCVKEYLNDP